MRVSCLNILGHPVVLMEESVRRILVIELFRWRHSDGMRALITSTNYHSIHSIIEQFRNDITVRERRMQRLMQIFFTRMDVTTFTVDVD